MESHVQSVFRRRLPHTDPDDQKVVDTYITTQTNHLARHDRHFSELAAAGFPAVRVVSAAEFMKLISKT